MGQILDDYLASQDQANASKAAIPTSANGGLGLPPMGPLTVGPRLPSAASIAAQPKTIDPSEEMQPSLFDKAKAIASKALDFVNPASPNAADHMTQAMQEAPGVIEGAGTGLYRSLGQFSGGLLDLSADAGKFVGDNIHHSLVRLGVPDDIAQGAAAAGTSMVPGADAAARLKQGPLFGNKPWNAPTGASLADILSSRQELQNKGNPAVNQFVTESAAAGALALVPGGEAPEAASLLARVAPYLSSATKAGLGAFIAMTPQGGTPEERTGSRLANAGMAAAADLTLGAGVAGAKALVPGLKAAGKYLTSSDTGAIGEGPPPDPLDKDTTITPATPEDQAADHLLRTAGTVRTATVRQAQADANSLQEKASNEQNGTGDTGTQEPAGGATPPGGGQETPQAGEGDQADTANPGGPGDSGLAEDGNALLEHAGATERLTGDPEVTPDGHILVSPDTKNVVDDAGVGRPFTSNPGDQDTTIFKETDPEGGSRVVGQIGNADLEGFVQDAVHWRDNPDGIATGQGHSTGQWALPLLGSQDDVSAMARALSDRIPPTPVPNNTPEALARARDDAAAITGLDPGDITRMAAQAASSPEKLGDAVLTVRLLHQAAVRDLQTLLDRNWATMDPESPEVAAALAKIHNALSIHSEMAMLKYKAGLELQRWGVPLDGSAATGIGLKPGDEIEPQTIPDFDTFISSFGKQPDADLAGKDPMLGPGLPRTTQELDDWLKGFQVAATQNGPGPVPIPPGTTPGAIPGQPGGPVPPVTPPTPPGSAPPAATPPGIPAPPPPSAGGTPFNPNALNAFLSGQTVSLKKWLYLRNSYVNFFTAAIVSAPRTLVRDMWGPGIISGLNTIGRSTVGAAQAINPFLSAAERQEAWTTTWGAPRAYVMAITDSLDVLKQAAATARGAYVRPLSPLGTPVGDHFMNPFGSNMGSAHGILGGHNPIDYNSSGVPTALINAATAANPGVTGAVPYWLGNAINKFPQIISSMHGGVNEFAQRLAYLGEVRAQAYIEASQQGLSGTAFDQYVSNRLLASDDRLFGGQGAATDPASFARAERTTLTRQVTTDDPAALQKAVELRAYMAKQLPESRFLLPIFTVPANALGETLRRIPVLNVAFQTTRDELAGRAGQFAQTDAFGRTLTGGAALTAGLGLASVGALTGAGPQQASARNAWLASGHQPYSVRVGDKWYSYQKSDIVGPMLGIMAGLYDRSVYTGEDDQHGAAAAAGALAEYFKDQASLQGLAELLNIGGNPSETENTVNRVLGTVGSGFVPNFIQQLATQTLDPLERVKRNPWDYIKAALPGVSTQLDPVRNLLGEPVHRPSSPGVSTFPVNIANANTYQNDPVMNEVARSYQNTGFTPGLVPTSPAPGAHFDLRDVKAEDGYSVYDHIMKHLGTVTDPATGSTLRQSLGDLFNSDEYRSAQDGHPGKSLDPEGDRQDTREGMTEKVFSTFHTLARQAAAQESPTAARYLAIASAKQHDSANLGNVPAAHLATPQGTAFMRALGINIEDYEATAKGNP